MDTSGNIQETGRARDHRFLFPPGPHRRSTRSPAPATNTPSRRKHARRGSWVTLAVSLLLAPLLVAGPALAKASEQASASSVDTGERIIGAATGTAVITGTVHAPVDPTGTLVAAYEMSDGFFPRSKAIVVGTSATSGTFELPWVPPGTYKLVYIPTRSSGLAMHWTNASSTRTHAATIVVDGGSVAVADETLQHPATISGRVTGPGGTGVGGITIGAFPPGHDWLAQSYAVTRPDGTYSLDRLAPGDYHVFVMPPSLSGLDHAWYPGVKWRSQAVVTTVQAGSFVPGADIAIPAAP